MEPNRAVADAKQTIILTHVVLIGLTPFIPVPFVDDYVKNRIQRRMVRRLAIANGIDLSAGDVATLGDDASGTWRGRILGLALIPVKRVFRKVFFVLGIKGIIDVASIAWHRAFLIDHALASGLCAPIGKNSATKVRAAIDAVCAEVPVTPLEPALKSAFEGSKHLLGKIGEVFGSIVGRADPNERAVDAAIDEASKAEDEDVGGVVERMRRSVTDVPSAHFDRLRSSLERRLK